MLNIMSKVDKHYVSPIDRELEAFNKTNPLSQSQRDEMAKHQKIAELRDNAILPETIVEDDLWK